MEESPSLTGHAARHCIYKQDYTAQERRRLEQERPPCSLSRNKCYELAVKEENWYITKLHLKEAPQRVNTSAGRVGVTALMNFGHKAEYAQYLLNLGADVNAQDKHGDSVLMNVVKHYFVETETVKILIHAGANVDIRDKYGTHLIMYAARLCENNVQVVKMLLAAGVSVQGLGTELNSFLVSAVQYPDENIDLFKMLIDGSTDDNVLSKNPSHSARCIFEKSSRALMCAVTNSRTSTQVVKMLIEAGAVVNAQDRYYRRSALMHACESDHIVKLEIAKLLVNEGANVNAQD
jgi:ankyrin repeat protein